MLLSLRIYFIVIRRICRFFINTHSPAFYQLGKQYNHVVLLYAFSQSSTEPQTLIENKPITTIESIDEQMGLFAIYNRLY